MTSAEHAEDRLAPVGEIRFFGGHWFQFVQADREIQAGQYLKWVELAETDFRVIPVPSTCRKMCGMSLVCAAGSEYFWMLLELIPKPYAAQPPFPPLMPQRM